MLPVQPVRELESEPVLVLPKPVLAPVPPSPGRLRAVQVQLPILHSVAVVQTVVVLAVVRLPAVVATAHALESIAPIGQ